MPVRFPVRSEVFSTDNQLNIVLEVLIVTPQKGVLTITCSQRECDNTMLYLLSKLSKQEEEK